MLHALPDGAQAELAVKIDFAPVRAAVPAGYLPDAGDVFGDRGGGLSYGWDADNRSSARDRNAANSPDQRYDTFTHTQRYGVRTLGVDPAQNLAELTSENGIDRYTKLSRPQQRTR